MAEELRNYPGYSLLVIGYSLGSTIVPWYPSNSCIPGAGLAQLLALELELGQDRALLPSGTKIRTIGYGSPPVFTSTTSIPVLENVFLVQNNNDWISGASLRNVNDVFLKTSAIDKLNYKIRDLLKLLLRELEDDENEEDTFYVENPIWEEVERNGN